MKHSDSPDLADRGGPWAMTGKVEHESPLIFTDQERTVARVSVWTLPRLWISEDERG